MTPTRIAALLAFATFTLFVSWYSSGGRPLSDREAARYLAEIERMPPEVRGGLDVTAFRRFLQNDDGLPFYNVNLFKFRAQAHYPATAEYPAGQSGRQAFERYSRFMLSTLPLYASHVVFGTTRTETTDWDMVATARYRSRRDFADLLVSPEFGRAVVHKWAALERNERIPAQARGLFASAYLPIGTALLLLVLGVYFFERYLWPWLRTARQHKEKASQAGPVRISDQR